MTTNLIFSQIYESIQEQLKSLLTGVLPAKSRQRLQNYPVFPLRQRKRVLASVQYNDFSTPLSGDKGEIPLRFHHLVILLRKLEYFDGLFSIHSFSPPLTYPNRLVIEFFEFVISLFDINTISQEKLCYRKEIKIYTEFLELWFQMFQNLCRQTTSVIENGESSSYLTFGVCQYSLKKLKALVMEDYLPQCRLLLQTPNNPDFSRLFPPLEAKLQQFLANATILWTEQENGLYNQVFSAFHLTLTPSSSPSSPFQSQIKELNEFVAQYFQQMQSDHHLMLQQNQRIQSDLERLLFTAWESEGLLPKVTLFGSRISGLSTTSSDLDLSLTVYRIHRDRPPSPHPAQNIQSFPHPHLGSKVQLTVSPIFIVNDRIKRGKQALPPASPTLQRFLDRLKQEQRLYYATDLLRKVRKAIQQQPKSFRFENLILGARTPIISLQHRQTKIDLDICCEQLFGIQNTLLIQNYCQFDVRIHQFLLLVKLWIRARRINQSQNGLLSSHSWCLVALYFLRRFQRFCLELSQKEAVRVRGLVFPEYRWTDRGREILRKSLSIEEEPSFPVDASLPLFSLQPSLPTTTTATSRLINEMTPGELLLWFFFFYGQQSSSFAFDFQRDQICLCEETKDLLQSFSPTPTTATATAAATSTTTGAFEEDWRMKVMDPLENLSLGKVIHSCHYQFAIQNELRRSFLFLARQTSPSSSSLPTTMTETNASTVISVLFAKQEKVEEDFFICGTCKEIGHVDTLCPYKRCGLCGQMGHGSSSCPSSHRDKGKNQEGEAKTNTADLSSTRLDQTKKTANRSVVLKTALHIPDSTSSANPPSTTSSSAGELKKNKNNNNKKRSRVVTKRSQEVDSDQSSPSLSSNRKKKFRRRGPASTPGPKPSLPATSATPVPPSSEHHRPSGNQEAKKAVAEACSQNTPKNRTVTTEQEQPSKKRARRHFQSSSEQSTPKRPRKRRSHKKEHQQQQNQKE